MPDPCTTLVKLYENTGFGFYVKNVSQLDLALVIAVCAWLRLLIEEKSKLNVGCVNDVLLIDLNGSVLVVDIVAHILEHINIITNTILLTIFIFIDFYIKQLYFIQFYYGISNKSSIYIYLFFFIFFYILSKFNY